MVPLGTPTSMDSGLKPKTGSLLINIGKIEVVGVDSCTLQNIMRQMNVEKNKKRN